MAKRPARPRDPNVLAKLVVDIATGDVTETCLPESKKAEAGRRGGLRGGKARATRLSPRKRKEIARKAATARWKRNPST